MKYRPFFLVSLALAPVFLCASAGTFKPLPMDSTAIVSAPVANAVFQAGNTGMTPSLS